MATFFSEVVANAAAVPSTSDQPKIEPARQQLKDFLEHLKCGIVLTKLSANKLAPPRRRVLYLVPSSGVAASGVGPTISWRAPAQSDFPSPQAYEADRASWGGHTPSKAESDAKRLALKDLTSVQYSTDKIKSNCYFIRLVFEGARIFDCEVATKEDFEYLMDGFENICKLRKNLSDAQ